MGWVLSTPGRKCPCGRYAAYCAAWACLHGHISHGWYCGDCLSLLARQIAGEGRKEASCAQGHEVADLLVRNRAGQYLAREETGCVFVKFTGTLSHIPD